MIPMYRLPGTFAKAATVVTGIGVAMCVLVHSGCVSPVSDYRAVDPSACYGLDSISFSSPSGPGWSFFEGRDEQVKYTAFLKKGNLPPHGFVAGVVEITSEDNVRTTDEMWAKVVEPVLGRMMSMERFQLTDKRVEVSDRFGTPSIRYHITGKDAGAPDKGNADYITLRAHGHAIVHPERDNTFVVMVFLERGHEDQMSEDTESRARELLDGLVLRPCE